MSTNLASLSSRFICKIEIITLAQVLPTVRRLAEVFKFRTFLSRVAGNFKEKLKWRPEVTETVEKKQASNRASQDHCPLAPTASTLSTIDMKGSC